jgi:hypothetical protein
MYNPFVTSKIPKPIFLVFCLSIAYWGLLFLTSHPSIGGDAQGYELLARKIYEKGWTAFFQGGPEREPLYPFIVSLSMRLADWLRMHYFSIQIPFQLAILGITQFLMYRILQMLNVRTSFICLALLYWGFSPAMTNSALSLYSEIAVYPLLLCLLLFTAKVWNGQWRLLQSIFCGLAFGILFLSITSIKAIFEYIFYLSLLPFIGLICKHIFQRRYLPSLSILLFILISLGIMNTALSAYKSLNKFHNDNYVLTDRSSWALYGSTIRRLQPLSKDRVLTALAYIPGKGFCETIYDSNRCEQWSAVPSDLIGLRVNALQGKKIKLPKEEFNQSLIDVSMLEVRQKPFQYALLSMFEGFKIFFWESTQTGFVVYHPFMQKIYDASILKNGLRLLMSILTFLALFICLKPLIHRRGTALLGWMLYIAFIYTAIHTPFFILTRYTFPIVPIFLICIAYALEQWYSKQTRKL